MALLAALVVPSPATASPAVEVVASGLDNPRGLGFAPNGALFIAEAGRGGDGECLPNPEGGEACLGDTGAVTRVWRGRQRRVATGLPSLANEGGNAAIGPHDVAFLGVGNPVVSIGLGQPPARRVDLGAAGAELGTAVRLLPTGEWQPIADLAAFEATNDPTGDGPDSNPYGTLAVPSGRYVVDAGGNSLVRVAADGAVSTVATFPARRVPFRDGEVAMQSVPTSVTRADDGTLYVGELTGFPFPKGEARIYRISTDGGVDVAATGFTNVIDVLATDDGSLYVLELATEGLLAGPPAGALHRIASDGTRTTVAGPDVLFAPGGVAQGPDGALYVTVCSVCAGGGKVLRLEG